MMLHFSFVLHHVTSARAEKHTARTGHLMLLLVHSFCKPPSCVPHSLNLTISLAPAAEVSSANDEQAGVRTSARDPGGRQSPRQRDCWPPWAAGQIQHAELACASERASHLLALRAHSCQAR